MSWLDGVWQGVGEGSSKIGGWAETFGEKYMGVNRLPMDRPMGDFSLSDQSRDLQGQYGALLRAQMAGKGPSLARGQLRQGTEAAVRAGTAAAASARGANVALAGRSAAQQAGRTTMQAARDAAQLRAAEQLAAQQQYGGLLQAQRQMDIDQAGKQLTADTAWTGYQLDRGEGEAERAQKGSGGMLVALGGLLSDPAAKQNVQPVGLTALNAAAPQQPGPVQASNGFSAQQLQGLVAAGAPPQSVAQQQAIDDAMMRALERRGAPNMAPLEQMRQEQQSGGLDIGAALTAAGGAVSSGIETKQDIYPVGQPMMQPSGIEMKQNVYPYGSPSDPQAKTNVRSFPALKQAAGVSPVVQQAAQVGTYGYEYRPEAAAQYGEQVGKEYFGPMANRTPDSLENNPLYQTAVKRDPQTGNAMVDGGRAAVTNIGVTSELAREQMRQSQELDAMKAAIIGELKGEKGGTKRQQMSQEQMRQSQELDAMKDAIIGELKGGTKLAGKADRKMQKAAPGRRRLRPSPTPDMTKPGYELKPGAPGPTLMGEELPPGLQPWWASAEGEQRRPLDGLKAAFKGEPRVGQKPTPPAPPDYNLYDYTQPRTSQELWGDEGEEERQWRERGEIDPRYETEGFARPDSDMGPVARYDQSLRSRSDEEMLDPEDPDLRVGGALNVVAQDVNAQPPGSLGRAAHLREAYDFLNRYRGGKPDETSTKFLHKRLKGRVKNLTEKEVRDALRDDVYL